MPADTTAGPPSTSPAGPSGWKPATQTHIRPLFERIVTTASRRSRHQTIRVIYLAILSGVAAIGMLVATSLGGQVSLRGLATAAAGVFEIVAILEVAAICLLTPVFMAGAIEQEASPRTWDLLLTTPLSSAGIVLGNLLGRVCLVVMLIAAALPILLILQVFGGIGPQSVLLAAAIAACTAVVVGAAAVLLSATRTGGKRATLVFGTGVLFMLIVTWVLDAAIRVPIPGEAAATSTTWATPLNPFLALQTVLRPSQYVADASLHGFAGFWLGHPVAAFAAVSFGAAFVMVLWATLRVRLIGPLAGGGRRGAATGTRAARPIGLNPIAWRASTGRPRQRWDALLRWGWAVLGITAAAVVLSMIGGDVIDRGLGRPLLTGLLAVQVGVLVLAASMTSAQIVTRDREQGTLDLLLTTPIQPTPYLRGHLAGIARLLAPAIAPPAMTAAAVATLVLSADPGSTWGPVAGPAGIDVPLANWGGALGIVLWIVPFTAFCIGLGLHWSLRSRRSTTAAVMTLTIAVLLAGILVPCVTALTDLGWIGVWGGSLCPLAGVVLALDADLVASFPAPETLQWALLAGGVLSAVIWSLATMMILKTTSRTFVATMRHLAGTS
ncbi:MAG: ABC transporter permease subunit [Phycisphaerales bacterium]|jgi:ABC-type transport system involved in multi-copper enzyme maturation permease subunit|nr:ABC transporter permease subunit [Phycisphaerales bacterium]